MFCTFFKKIGLSIALLFSSLGNFFHKPKPTPAITSEQIAQSDFLIKKQVDMVSTSTYSPEPIVVKELTLKEKIKEQEAILKQLRRQRKAEKRAKKEADYAQWKAEQREVMLDIDRKLAQMPAQIESMVLTIREVDAVVGKNNIISIKNIDEPNNIFEDVVI